MAIKTFVYQKIDNTSANYIESNRGCENGAYYNCIVNNYYSIPDIAIFTHARPHDHNLNWLDLVKCVRQNATYFSINTQSICRDSWNGV